MNTGVLPSLDAKTAHPVSRIARPLLASARAAAGSPWGISALTCGFLLLVWAAITATGLIAPLFLPSPLSVLRKLAELSSSGFVGATLWQHLGASLARVGLALAAALVIAIPVGLAMGLHPRVRAVLDPLIEFYRPIPPLAYLPLVVIWFGIDELSKILLIWLAIFAPVVIATVSGVARTDESRLRAAQSFGATRWQLVRHIVLPSALPDILTGVRVGLGVGWSTLVAAELVAAQRGLGFMIQSAAQFLNTEIVVAGILVIAAVAFALEFGLRRLQRRWVPWQGRV
jgi:taurine transport system permease protein